MTRRPAPLFPSAVRLEACRVIWQEGSRPVLMLRTLTREGRAGLFALPEGVGVRFQVMKKGLRVFFSSPDNWQALDLTEAVYSELIEGLARLMEARQTVGRVSPSEDLPEAGHTLKCAALLPEVGGVALYLGTSSPDFAACVYRVGPDVRVSVDLPHPLPAERLGTCLKGRLVLEGPAGQVAVTVPTVHTARALLEVLQKYGEGKRGAA